MLFVNAEPAVLDQPISARMLELVLSDLPFRIVTEYTERALSSFPAVRAVHREVCAVVAATARRTGAMVIAEGIETPADVEVARSLGATWGQGWHFGRPVKAADLGLRAGGPVPGIRDARPGLHQPVGSPFDVAVAGAAGLAGDTAIVPALERMSAAVDGQQHAVVLGSYGDPGDVAQWLPHIERATRQAVYTSVLRPNSPTEPFPGESSLVIMTPDHAAALCRRPGVGVVVTEARHTVAAIGRVLLQRLAADPDTGAGPPTLAASGS